MATDKKSFILYTDLIHTIESLKDDEAGMLFKHLLRYVNDLNPTAPDRIIQLVFEPIKQQLKRDLKDWEKTITGKSEGGKKSAEIRKNLKLIKEEVSILKSVQHTSTNSTVNDSVNVTVNDSVNVIKEYRRFAHLKISFDEFDKLISEGFTKQQIDETLDSIENYKKNKNYTSLLLTCRKWMKKNNLENGTSENDKFKLGRISGDKVAEFLQQ